MIHQENWNNRRWWRMYHEIGELFIILINGLFSGQRCSYAKWFHIKHVSVYRCRTSIHRRKMVSGEGSLERKLITAVLFWNVIFQLLAYHVMVVVPIKYEPIFKYRLGFTLIIRSMVGHCLLYVLLNSFGVKILLPKYSPSGSLTLSSFPWSYFSYIREDIIIH